MVRFAATALALVVSLLGTSLLGSEILLLDFWSPSCPPCMQMKPIVASLENARYPIRQIDTTRDPQLARQFNVDRFPCFVMLVDGREIDRIVGATSSEQLQQMFQKAKDEVERTQRIRYASPDGQPSFSPTAAEPPRAVGPQQQPIESTWPPQVDQTIGTAPTRTMPASEPQQVTPTTPANLLVATVRLRVEDAQGHAYGTGTIVDARSGEALIITCGHLFRESQGKGPVTVELFEGGPNGLRVAGQVPGQVISYDLDRDVALVSIRPERAVATAPIAPPRTAIERGDRVASIGCSNGKDPSILESRVTSTEGFQPPSIEVAGAPVEGRSGGGLFNLKGQLVGVCFAADQEGNEGLYAALESIHAELDRLGLKEIYAKAEASPTTPPLVARGQEEPLVPITPIPNDQTGTAPAGPVETDPVQVSATPPPGLSETEQAAWEEIMSRTATSEVIIIVRPKEGDGESEVIQLESVSPEFLRALNARRRKSEVPLTR